MAADSVSEQDVELAKVARDAFNSHRYESCLSALNKLLDSRRHDGRVVHNRAVAQFLLSNLTHTDEFRRTLQSVSTQVVVVACIYSFYFSACLFVYSLTVMPKGVGIQSFLVIRLFFSTIKPLFT